MNRMAEPASILPSRLQYLPLCASPGRRRAKSWCQLEELVVDIVVATKGKLILITRLRCITFFCSFCRIEDDSPFTRFCNTLANAWRHPIEDFFDPITTQNLPSDTCSPGAHQTTPCGSATIRRRHNPRKGSRVQMPLLSSPCGARLVAHWRADPEQHRRFLFSFLGSP